MTRICPECDGHLRELSVDGPVNITSVFEAVMELTTSETLRIQAVCTSCDKVVEKEVVIDPYREIERWNEPTSEEIAETTGGDPKNQGRDQLHKRNR